jgi:hypothetical protein
MSGTHGMSVPRGGAGRVTWLPWVALVAAFLALVLVLISFRGLVFLTLPLSIVALVAGAWSAVAAARPATRLVGVMALIVGLLVLLVSLLALAVDVTVTDGYDYYERRRP